MKKDQLDELLKLDDEGTNKKIKKIIHKKIYSRIIIFTIIITLVIVTIAKGYQYISDYIYITILFMKKILL